MHGNRMVSPNSKFISSLIKQSEHFDEEILEKDNNKYYIPTQFKNALNKLIRKKQNLYMHLNIWICSLKKASPVTFQNLIKIDHCR